MMHLKYLIIGRKPCYVEVFWHWLYFDQRYEHTLTDLIDYCYVHTYKSSYEDLRKVTILMCCLGDITK